MKVLDIRAKLERCHTSDDVADLCRENAVKGDAQDSYSCPLANLLRKADDVAGLPYDEVYVGNMYARTGETGFNLPDSARAFVERIDDDDPKLADLIE